MTVHVWLDDYKSAALAANDQSLSASPLQAVQTFRAEVFRQVALEYFDSLVREHPGSCRARLVRAMNFAAQEKAEAEAEFLAAIEACPLDTQIRIELADYYLWNSQYDQARQACLDELEIHPHSGAAKKRLGRIHVQLREGEMALPYLTAAAAADPEDADVRSDLGRAYELLERWEDAVQAYLLAVELDPALNRARYVLARLYRQLGQSDLAQQQFQLFKRNEDEARRTRNARIQRLRKKEAPGSAPGER
jgi:tetratricopeptide (TPR) repeat protein